MLDISKIRAITLDLDDTLWPIWPTIERAEKVLHAWLQVQAPATATLIADAHMRRALRDATERQWPGLAHDLSALRRESIRLALQRAGDDASLAEAAMTVFLDQRMQVTLFDDSRAALAWMAQRWPVVALSNGNADVQRIGLGEFFAASISARDVGVGKPDPRIFQVAADSAGVPVHEVLHVGDDAALDVLGALDVGMQTVWVNREDHLWTQTRHPHATVADLAELCDLLGRTDTD